MKSGLIPSRLIVNDGLIEEDFSRRLESLKEATNLSWEILAACLGVDPRQLLRWREGTKPSGDGVNALVKLASRIPGGIHILFGVHVIPPSDACQASLGSDFDRYGNGG